MTTVSSQDERKVLVIDDESSIITYLTTLLEDHGYETCHTGDPRAALAMAREQRPDLITLDVMMPRQSGVALYQEFKLAPELREVPVVFVSAFSRSSGLGPASFRETVPDERIPPPDAYIEKPVIVAEFLETVAALIDPARTKCGPHE